MVFHFVELNIKPVGLQSIKPVQIVRFGYFNVTVGLYFVIKL